MTCRGTPGEDSRQERARVGAVEPGDVVAAADALADLGYVVYGAALRFCVDLDRVLAEVHRSNMTRSPAGDGEAIKGFDLRAPPISRSSLILNMTTSLVGVAVQVPAGRPPVRGGGTFLETQH